MSYLERARKFLREMDLERGSRPDPIDPCEKSEKSELTPGRHWRVVTARRGEVELLERYDPPTAPGEEWLCSQFEVPSQSDPGTVDVWLLEERSDGTASRWRFVETRRREETA